MECFGKLVTEARLTFHGARRPEPTRAGGHRDSARMREWGWRRVRPCGPRRGRLIAVGTALTGRVLYDPVGARGLDVAAEDRGAR